MAPVLWLLDTGVKVASIVVSYLLLSMLFSAAGWHGV